MDAARLLRVQTHANRLANQRLHGALQRLQRAAEMAAEGWHEAAVYGSRP